MVIYMPTLKPLANARLNLEDLSCNRSNEQSIAPKSPISRFLKVARLRRLDECSRSDFQVLDDIGGR
jgi:hypothetical protein